MRALLTDAHVRLLRGIRSVLQTDADLAGWLAAPTGLAEIPEVRGLLIENFESEPWASLTFTGMRHKLDIRLVGDPGQVADAYERLKFLLADPPLHLPGHFLAELELIDSLGQVREDGRMDLAVRIEALTIEE